MKTYVYTATVLAALALPVAAMDKQATIEDIEGQRQALAAATAGMGFGPQAPRDLTKLEGLNTIAFNQAPAYTQMNLCNIHFHKNAEHRGGQFTKWAGPGDGSGYNTGYVYTGELTEAELSPLAAPIADKGHGGMVPGDTIEVHYVHTSAQVTPGPTLGACLSEAIGNPQLRVETQVFVLVNDPKAADFVELAAIGEVDGYQQALNIPNDTGTPIQYNGSTTGPSFNEKGSPFQVSWSVRPDVMKLDINSVDAWLKNNIFNEDHAHGVRNLVENQDLLSKIQ